MESYLEPLYDEEGGAVADDAKVWGTAMLLELTRDPGNIEALVQVPALLGALSRVLADDAPRGVCSPALLYNVLRLLVVFSNFYEASVCWTMWWPRRVSVEVRGPSSDATFTLLPSTDARIAGGVPHRVLDHAPAGDGAEESGVYWFDLYQHAT